MVNQKPIDLKTRFALRLATLWLKLCLRLTKYAADNHQIISDKFHQRLTLLDLYISVINILHNRYYMNRFPDRKQRMEIFLYMKSNNKNYNRLLYIVLDEIDKYKKN